MLGWGGCEAVARTCAECSADRQRAARSFDLAAGARDDDLVFERDGVALVVDAVSYEFVRGAAVDFTDSLIKSTFKARAGGPAAAHSAPALREGSAAWTLLLLVLGAAGVEYLCGWWRMVEVHVSRVPSRDVTHTVLAVTFHRL